MGRFEELCERIVGVAEGDLEYLSLYLTGIERRLGNSGAGAELFVAIKAQTVALL
jgi:hypothetical protein